MLPLPLPVTLAVMLVAIAVDALLGDPPWLQRRVPHPVVLLGRLIDWLDQRCNREEVAAGARRWRGCVASLLVVGAGAVIGWALQNLCLRLPFGWLILGVIMSSLLAARGLHDHVAAVAAGLERSLDDGRRAVAHIVGRDPESLDQQAVARAAIESSAENFADGVVAPVFWGLLLGLPGMAGYKAINTLDSMIGHRSSRHLDFGRFAARLDDVANWVPARLAALLILVAALGRPGADIAGGWQAMWRDARHHRSPNAGWPEAATAGALGLRLAGPRRYGGEVVEDAWMGDGRDEATADDIRRALRLFVGANVAGFLLLVGALAISLAS